MLPVKAYFSQHGEISTMLSLSEKPDQKMWLFCEL